MSSSGSMSVGFHTHEMTEFNVIVGCNAVEFKVGPWNCVNLFMPHDAGMTSKEWAKYVAAKILEAAGE